MDRDIKSTRSLTRFGVLFLSVGTVFVLGFFTLNQLVSGFYHGNLIEGNYGTKYLWVFGLAIFVNWLYAIYVIKFSQSKNKTIKIGPFVIIFFLLIVGYGVATLIPREHYIQYYLGQEKYSIPWQYNPRNGSTISGGGCLFVQVSYPDLVARYSSENYRQSSLDISKCILDEREKIGVSLDGLCNKGLCGGLSYASNSYFTADGFIYYVYHQGREVTFRNQDDTNKFKKSVIDLFEYFKSK